MMMKQFKIDETIYVVDGVDGLEGVPFLHKREPPAGLWEGPLRACGRWQGAGYPL